jgi:hypothetical protein
LRECRFVEISFERRPRSAVAPMVFEPEPELLSPSVSHADSGRGEAAPVNARPSEPMTVATAELEVEALSLLNQVGADLGEQLSLERTPDGRLKIQGILETEGRKREILQALGPVANNPAVKLEIFTVEEAVKQQPQPQPPAAGRTVTMRELEIRNDAIPAYQELRRHFAGAGDRVDEEARRFASRVVNRSHQAMQRAGALKRLVKQFSEDDLRALSPEARAKWLSLIHWHARAFQGEVEALRHDLQPIFFPTPPPVGEGEGITISGGADLERAVERLFALGSGNDRVIRSAFATSADVTQVSAIKAPEFWRSLASAESLAEKLAGVK